MIFSLGNTLVKYYNKHIKLGGELKWMQKDMN
jgi:hypothetical protein